MKGGCMKIKLFIYSLGAVLMCYSASYARIKVNRAGDYQCQTQNGLPYCVDKDNRPLTGKIEHQNSEGIVVKIENYQKGYPSGLTTIFDDKGALLRRTYYKKGIKNGVDREYHNNRSIKTSATYKNGILNGRVEHYDQDGNLLGRLTYKNGLFEKGYCIQRTDGKKQKINIQPTGQKNLISCGG